MSQRYSKCPSIAPPQASPFDRRQDGIQLPSSGVGLASEKWLALFSTFQMTVHILLK